MGWFGNQISFFKHGILVEVLRVCGEEVPFDKEAFLFGGAAC